MTNVPEKASHAYALSVMAEAMRELSDPRDIWICIQPGASDPIDENRVRVDELAQALFGKPGEGEHRSYGWKHDADGRVGPIRVSITARVPGPPDERDAEIERLRAELAKRDDEHKVPLEHRLGLDYSRGDTEVEPVAAKPDTLGVPLGHHGNGEVHIAPLAIEDQHAEAAHLNRVKHFQTVRDRLAGTRLALDGQVSDVTVLNALHLHAIAEDNRRARINS